MAAGGASGTYVRTTDIASSAITRAHFTTEAQCGSRRLSAFIARLLIEEFLVVAGSTYLASVIYQTIVIQEWPLPGIYITSAMLVGFTVVLVSIGPGRYMNLQRQARHTFMWNGFRAVCLAFSFLLSGLFLFKIAEPYSRATFLMQFITVVFAVLTNRAMAHVRLQCAIAKGLLEARRVVLLGDEENCARFAAGLKGTGICLIGSFPFPVGSFQRAAPGIGADQARRFIDECRKVAADDIVMLSSHDNLMRTAGWASSLSELPVGLHVALVESTDLLAAAQIVEFGHMVTLQVSQPPLSIFDRVAKRAFDVVVASAALLILSPLMLFVAIAIKLDTRGPVLFRQMRHGYNNETIQVFKFRTMTACEAGEKFVQARRDDPRITRFGRLLRRTNIDELPQFINVLRGEMSIVGPRPHATAHNEMFEKRISLFSRRHIVKPGITGWAQVNGYRGDTDTLEKMRRRVEYDLYYIDNWSLLFDLQIVVLTLLSKRAYVNAY
jgi:Undecaprenyl-phosphate glucose phosphotransferase